MSYVFFFFLLCRPVRRNSTEGKRGRGKNFTTIQLKSIYYFFNFWFRFVSGWFRFVSGWFRFVSFRLVPFRFDWFRFVSIGSVSFRLVPFRFDRFHFVSFWFRFALYRDPWFWRRSKKKCQYIFTLSPLFPLGEGRPPSFEQI
jgi:hypothetical protein